MNDREAVPPFLKSKGEVKSIIPYTRKEMFLAYAAGEDVDKPTPITREEYFLCYLGDSSASIPDPITRTEKFIAKVYNDAVETPKPTTRLEYILAYITDGSRDTFDAFTPTTREEHFLLNAAEYIKQHSHITFTLSYYNDDGSVLLYSESVAEGGNGEYKGETPTKASTEQYDYSFVGWSSETGATEPTTDVLKNITADKSVYAAFEAVEKTYDVKFYNADVLLYTDENVEYGGTAAYSGNTPTKAETAQYTYTFIGWNSNSSASTADDNALTNVTADRNVYAIFTAVSKGYTVYFYNGETLLETVTGVPSGGTATYTGATPTSSQAGYIFSGWSPSNTNITADTSCYAQFVDEDMYESISDTWSEIIANVSNGTYSTKYHIGDTKKIDLGTEGEVIMTIVGIDTDDLADNSGKAPITWISKQRLKTDHRMNPTKQSGTSGTGALGGWEACEMRSYLINTIKPLLPSEVRNALKTVKKYSRIYNTSETAVNNVVSNDDIWIPSAYEVNFSGYETSGVTYSTAFPDNASRIKHKVGGSAVRWWLRSAGGAGLFRAVYYDGSGGDSGAGSSSGVAVGFVI